MNMKFFWMRKWANRLPLFLYSILLSQKTPLDDCSHNFSGQWHQGNNGTLEQPAIFPILTQRS